MRNQVFSRDGQGPSIHGGNGGNVTVATVASVCVGIKRVCCMCACGHTYEDHMYSQGQEDVGKCCQSSDDCGEFERDLIS